MAELNLKQITDKLSSEFSSDVRRLIFWYDARGDFALDIDSMELENAKIIKLEPDNQFYIKYLLERQDTTTTWTATEKTSIQRILKISLRNRI